MKPQYDYEKIKASVGQQIKVKVHGRFRRGRIVDTGRHRETRDPFVKVRIDNVDMIWSAPFQQIAWYPMAVVRKADKAGWLMEGAKS